MAYTVAGATLRAPASARATPRLTPVVRLGATARARRGAPGFAARAADFGACSLASSTHLLGRAGVSASTLAASALADHRPGGYALPPLIPHARGRAVRSRALALGRDDADGGDETASAASDPATDAASRDGGSTAESSSSSSADEDASMDSDASRDSWHRFLSRTTFVVGAMVVVYSASTPYPVNDGGRSFATALAKRLGAVAAARWIARKLVDARIVRSLAEAAGARVGVTLRAVRAAFARDARGRDAEGRAATLGSVLAATVRRAKAKYDANPRGILLIPVVAAFVGWFTNWLAVKMIFYPIGFVGVPIAQMVEGYEYGYPILNPLGLVGWQGIVPAKAAQMAHTMVTMVTTKLIDVQEVFLRLSPNKIADLLAPEVPAIAREVADAMGTPRWAANLGERALPSQCGPLLRSIDDAVHRYLAGFVEVLQRETHRVVDLKELVVREMCEDKSTLVQLFQRCGREELKFLTNSGLWFGFLLGVAQALCWLVYDNPWTLTIGGTIVGLLTNWLALKCIFEPIEPHYFFGGRLKIQGLFLQRQHEVSGEFSDHLAKEVLTSEKVWKNMLEGERSEAFTDVLREYTRDFLRREAQDVGGRGIAFGGWGGEHDPAFVDAVVAAVKSRLGEHVAGLHAYTDAALGLEALMRERMALMTPSEFERVLHPIFEQDELTLILSGAALGALAGFAQQVYTVAVADEDEETKREEEIVATEEETLETNAPSVQMMATESSTEAERNGERKNGHATASAASALGFSELLAEKKKNGFATVSSATETKTTARSARVSEETTTSVTSRSDLSFVTETTTRKNGVAIEHAESELETRARREAAAAMAEARESAEARKRKMEAEANAEAEAERSMRAWPTARSRNSAPFVWTPRGDEDA